MTIVEKKGNLTKGFITINKVPTQVLCFGEWLETDGKQPIVLVIPGNPGCVEFYEEFMRELYDGMNKNVQIWGVSYAGHVLPPDPMELPPIKKNKDLYLAEAQVNHKIAFIERYIPEGTPLILIGHSGSCHLILETMKRLPNLNILKTYMIFPAFQQLHDCDEAPRISRFFKTHVQLSVLLLFSILRLLPEMIQRLFFRIYYALCSNSFSTPDCVISASFNYLNSQCAIAPLVFAEDVIKRVKERDDQTIRKYLQKLVIYYVENDNWCPIKNYHDIKKTFPDGNIILCDRGFPHAFVIKHSVDMGKIVKGWIREMVPGIYPSLYT